MEFCIVIFIDTCKNADGKTEPHNTLGLTFESGSMNDKLITAIWYVR